MTARSRTPYLLRIYPYFVLLIAISAEQVCDKTKCPGPLMFYQDMGCIPVYKNKDDCCAVKYNCDHLDDRSMNKCYINGHSYDIGEALREEDKRPCNGACHCGKRSKIASFVCPIVDCFYGFDQQRCYMKRDHGQCCGWPEACPYKEPDLAKCIVDGETYYDGQYFSPKSEPNLDCYCKPGYKGENVEPFCKVPKLNPCGAEMHHAEEIHDKCAPVYYSTQDPATSCFVAMRCQNENDTIIPAPTDSTKSAADEDSVELKAMACKYGNMTMPLGSELNQATGYSSVCVKCVCEVPPVPTCQRLDDKICDVTDHPPFDS